MTSRNFPSHPSISALFEAQVAAYPDAVALSLDGQPLNYGELNSRANRLAAYLRELGVGPDSLVGLFFDRTFDLIISLFAILKAGGAYLPLDLACPAERLAFQLRDSGAAVVLTAGELTPRLKGFAGKVICLDQAQSELARFGEENLPSTAQPHALAYVIYTSGSTGQPKGVQVTQENVTRLFSTTDELFHFGPDDVWTLFHSSAFDFSVWEIFGALLYGGRLVLVPYMVSRSAGDFHQLVVREKVTVLNQTPSAFRQFIAVDQAAPSVTTSLRYVIFGGEALEYQSLRPWFARHGDSQPQCVNMYGITETTVHVTYHAVTRTDLEIKGSNIGRPLPDLQVYLVDEKGAQVAPGEMGEMLVGGRGVARGYLHREELTAQRFVPNAFDPATQGGRLYKSGDLARARPNGDLEYLGRSDHQVKVRGHRVELSEIESALARHDAIRECAVLSRAEEGQDPRLVAYFVSQPGLVLDVELLRAYLSQSLPGYMVPSAFVSLSEFPLTLNGKLDRAALPAPTSSRPQLASAFIAPQDDLQQTIARLWKAALRQETVGIDDNFFDLGGDSLLLTTLHRQLQAELRREFPITHLFQFPTVRTLADHLGTADAPAHLDEKAESRAQLQRAALHRLRRPAVTQP